MVTFREALRILWTEASGFARLRLGLALLLVTTAASLSALGPVALKMIVDALGPDAKTAAIGLGMLIAAYVASQWLSRVAADVRGLVYAAAERRMARTLSERLFAHIMHLPLRFHLERQTGALTQTMTNGLQGYQQVLNTLVFMALPAVGELATIIVVLSRIDQSWFLGLFAGALLFYGSAFAYAARRTASAARVAAAAQIDATGAVTDSILNSETVKYFRAEAAVQNRIGGYFARTELHWVRFFRRHALNGLIVSSIFALFLAATATLATREVREGRMTLGTFVLVNTYMLQIVRPVEMIGLAVQGFSQGLAFLSTMLDVFRREAEDMHCGALTAPPGHGRLDFQSVSFGYQPDRAVLKDVTFTLPAGRTLAVVGESGSGKSSIVRLLTRLLEPDSGRILLDEVPVRELSLARLRDLIAVVPQDTVLFNDSIRYNIAFGRPGCTQQDVEQAAKLAHLHDFVLTLPEGYDTPVGERGVKLSGGEKQRISIARAAIKHPRIYVFDEATSSLDGRTEREILLNLREISRHSTTLVIAHRLSTIVDSDEIMVLAHGSIAERGTHHTLLAKQALYAALWAAQNGAPATVREKSATVA
jgi:ATP-binding cassette subfamily B protein